jgi:hypothetical protein
MLLVDHDANFGDAGNDFWVCLIHSVHVKTIDNHQLTDVSDGSVGGGLSTQKVVSFPLCISMHCLVKVCSSAHCVYWNPNTKM